MEICVDTLTRALYLPAKVVEPDLVTDDDVDDDDLTSHTDAVFPVGDRCHRSPIPVQLDVQRLVSPGESVQTEEIDPGDGNNKYPVLSVEVRPQVCQGLGEADVSEVVGDRRLQEDIEGNKLFHVSRTGVKSLEAVLTWQSLRITENNTGYLVLLTFSKQVLPQRGSPV